MDASQIDRMAELFVGFGVNLQPGQVLGVTSEIGKEELTRAIARAAYRGGAHFVDVVYLDPYVKRARVELASDEALTVIPPWLGARARALGETRAANLSLIGSNHPDALAGLDPVRLGRDVYPRLAEWLDVVSARLVNWCVVPATSPGWASVVHPDLPPDEALARLEQEILHVLRLDEDDPAAAWRTRNGELLRAAHALTARRFDAIHLEGPGTDLTVGLLPSSIWQAAGDETVDGVTFHANLPSEEVFTCPDPLRADGHVTATKPLNLAGSVVRGLRVRFEGGRAVQVDADENADVLRGRVAIDDGASRLGELALVDGSGRIGPLGTTFLETLLDENAASHIALGGGFDFGVDDADERRRINRSGIHIDFMIGSPEVDVTGITRDGARVPVLRDGGVWQI